MLNSLLYLYDFIGINGFLTSGIVHILFFILSYLFVALIEMNIGHIALLFLLFVDIMLMISLDQFKNLVCTNRLNGADSIANSPYCCGSFVLYMSLGFVLYIILKNMNTILKKGALFFLILFVWIICILVDKYISFADSKENDSIKTCRSFLHHATNFLLGVFSGLVLAN